MATELEVLQNKVSEQDRTIRVLRAALSGREELLSIPADGVVDVRWLQQFKRQLKEQAVLELRAATAGRPDAARPEPSAAAAPAARTEFLVRPPDVAAAGGGAGTRRGGQRGGAGQAPHLPEAGAACVRELLATTSQLAAAWQDALRERYEGLLSAFARAFAAFKAAPSDPALQKFLAAVDGMQAEVAALVGGGGGSAAGDDESDFGGAAGNPFAGDTDELADYFAAAFHRYAEQARAEADGAAATRSEEAAAAAAARADLAKALERCTAQRDTLHEDVARWKTRCDEVEEGLHAAEAAAAAAAAAATRRRDDDAVSLSSAPSSAYSLPRQHVAGSTRRGAKPAGLPGLSPLPSHQDFGSGGGGGGAPSGGGTARMEQLRSALGHMEAQLAAACYNNAGSTTRHQHISRRMASVRAALAAEEAAAAAATSQNRCHI